jgi:ATP-dependent Lon protease
MAEVETLAVLPLRNAVLFPHTAISVDVRGKLAQRIGSGSVTQMVAIAQRDWSVADPGPTDLYAVGTVASLYPVQRSEPMRLRIEGKTRVRVVEWLKADGAFEAKVEAIAEGDTPYEHAEAWLWELRQLAMPLLDERGVTQNVVRSVKKVTSPFTLADLLASNLLQTVQERQVILEAAPPQARVERVLKHLRRISVEQPTVKLTAAAKWRRLWRAIVGLFD